MLLVGLWLACPIRLNVTLKFEIFYPEDLRLPWDVTLKLIPKLKLKKTENNRDGLNLNRLTRINLHSLQLMKNDIENK